MFGVWNQIWSLDNYEMPSMPSIPSLFSFLNTNPLFSDIRDICGIIYYINLYYLSRILYYLFF